MQTVDTQGDDRMQGNIKTNGDQGSIERNNFEQRLPLLDNRYRLEKAMGRTFLAVHIGTGCRMVIKPKCHFQDPRVIRHLSQLRHPALPRIMDEITIDYSDTTEPYLVTEYLEGTTFSEWAQSSGGKLLPDQLMPLMAETARTLAFLHEQNEPSLLHLDLKPEHLIRLTDGHAGLIDFDNARLFPTGLIEKPDIRCTAGYTAPEMMMGTPVPQTDIYALGVTMLILLTGQGMADQTLPPLEPLCRYLPPAVTMILETCLNTDPTMRYPSAAALACALENLSLKKVKRIVPTATHFGPVLPEKPDGLAATADVPEKMMSHQSGNRMQRYPDQLVVIWDHALFAVRLAEHLARSGNQTIVVDADLLNPRVDLLLGIHTDNHRDVQPNGQERLDGKLADSHLTGLEIAMTALMRKTLPPEQFPELLQKTKIPHLMALTGQYKLRDYDYYDPETLLSLFRMTRIHADVVLVCCNRFIHDSFTCLSLLAADLVLIPLPAEPVSIREYNRYIDFLASQYPFDRGKVRFVAVEYDQDRHLSWGMVDELCGGRLAGCIPRTRKKTGRPANHNMRSFFTRYANADEYDQLLRRLGFFRHERPGAEQAGGA